MTAATFDTAEFFRSHGRQPRGTGCWAFKADGQTEWMFSPSMSFSQAKAWAKAQAPNARRFTVGP